VWQHPLSTDTIRSLLNHQAFASADITNARNELRARGVKAIFCSRRVQAGNPPQHNGSKPHDAEGEFAGDHFTKTFYHRTPSPDADDAEIHE
jgi:hypothetical protein